MSSRRAKEKTRPTKSARQTEEAICHRLYTCCHDPRCTWFQKALSFFDSFGIEPELGLDEDGHYFDFSLPKEWVLCDRRRFNEAIAGYLSSDAEPCNICGSVMYSDSAIATCADCGEEFVMCEECLLEEEVPCDYQDN